MAAIELSKLLGCEAAASLKIRLVGSLKTKLLGCEVGAGVSLYCCQLLG